MRLTRLMLLCSVFWGAFVPAQTLMAAEQEPGLAVLRLNYRAGIKTEQAQFMAERLRVLFAHQGVFQVDDEAKMKAVYARFPLHKTCDTSCAVSYGKHLGVPWVLQTTVQMHEADYRLRVQLIEVATGKVRKTELHQCGCPLGEVLERIAKNFSDDFSKLKTAH